MTEFTNETIDTSKIPRFESVKFTNLEPNYWKVKLIYFSITFFVFALIYIASFFIIQDFYLYQYEIGIGFMLLFLLVLSLQRIGFKKKKFAFRNHDVLFKFGIIATNIIIIPYNRVQHVATHEDFVSRIFGLVTLEIFTAGQSSSDINIPGIKREQAENIKELLVSKIQNQL